MKKIITAVLVTLLLAGCQSADTRWFRFTSAPNANELHLFVRQGPSRQYLIMNQDPIYAKEQASSTLTWTIKSPGWHFESGGIQFVSSVGPAGKGAADPTWSCSIGASNKEYSCTPTSPLAAGAYYPYVVTVTSDDNTTRLTADPGVVNN